MDIGELLTIFLFFFASFCSPFILARLVSIRFAFVAGNGTSFLYLFPFTLILVAGFAFLFPVLARFFTRWS